MQRPSWGVRAFSAIVVLSLLPFSGCQNNTQTGAALGTGAGALAGTIIGHQVGNKGAGALIGGLAGGLTGAVQLDLSAVLGLIRQWLGRLGESRAPANPLRVHPPPCLSLLPAGGPPAPRSL